MRFPYPNKRPSIASMVIVLALLIAAILPLAGGLHSVRSAQASSHADEVTPAPPQAGTPDAASAADQLNQLSGPISSVPPMTPWYAPRLAYYYKQVENITVQELAKEFAFFILAKGNETFRDQLIAAGGRHPILVHIRNEAIHDPGSCTAIPWQNNVAYNPGDFCNISKNHPSWFLLDTSGKRIQDTEEGQTFYLMDPANPEWQKFWIERVSQVLADPKWDGVFMDNVEVTLDFRQAQNEVPQKYQTDDAYWQARQSFLKAVYTGFFQPNHKLLFGNIASRKDDAKFPDYVVYMDGAMFEGWSVDLPDRWRSVERYNKHLDAADAVQKNGKFIMLISQGQKDDNELQRFAYASYLLVNQGDAAFRYGYNLTYREAWVYDNYHINLGAPKGPRYKVGTYAWRRDYEYGYVIVDPNAHTSEIKQTSTPPVETPTPIPTNTPEPSVTPSVTPTTIPAGDIKGKLYFPVIGK